MIIKRKSFENTFQFLFFRRLRLYMWARRGALLHSTVCTVVAVASTCVRAFIEAKQTLRCEIAIWRVSDCLRSHPNRLNHERGETKVFLCIRRASRPLNDPSRTEGHDDVKMGRKWSNHDWKTSVLIISWSPQHHFAIIMIFCSAWGLANAYPSFRFVFRICSRRAISFSLVFFYFLCTFM